jgi:hypothetical protein
VQLQVQYFQQEKIILDRHHDMQRDGANPLSSFPRFTIHLQAHSFTGPFIYRPIHLQALPNTLCAREGGACCPNGLNYVANSPV